jgi:glycosyltransferase involved in cell wall biosynthesis
MVARLLARYPETEINARIVGDGPWRCRLEMLAKRLSLGTDRLEFLGNQKEMAAIYNDSDILVLTSDWEGTPNVILEAMACGLPVISSRVGGVPELLSDGRGILVDAADEDGFVEATARLSLNGEMRRTLGERGRTYVARCHAVHTLAEQLLVIYRRVLPL